MRAHPRTNLHTFRAGFLACGLGAGARGFVEARATRSGHEARFVNAGGVDIDEDALADFRRLAGNGPTSSGDLHTMQPAELRALWGDDAPDVVFSSTPCKGLSRLLGAEAASQEKYQELNRLTVKSFNLVLATYPKKPPKLLILENVPGIASRGADLLVQLIALLDTHGYMFHRSTHDCGELGGLGQHRRRFLLVARHAESLPGFLYQPPKQRVRGCGEIIGPLPLPNVAEAGPLHVMPRISWINWVRLALIPPGGDWRDLPRAVTTQPNNEDAHQNKHAVADWTEPTKTVTGAKGIGDGALSIADARVAIQGNDKAAQKRWEQKGEKTPGQTHWFKGKHGVMPWGEPSRAVIGGPSNGASNVADPRVQLELGHSPHRGGHGVQAWDKPAKVVRGAAWDGKHASKYRVRPFGEPVGAVTGETDVQEGAPNVADSRVALGCKPRSGAYGVLGLGQPADTVTGSASIDNGAVAVADHRPRPPLPPGYVVMTIDEALAHATSPKAKPDVGVVPVIYSPTDGTWHRPLTTLELAALQGLPTTLDGKPLTLTAKSAAKQREHIGNAVPVGAAKAIAGQMLETLLLGALGMFFTLTAAEVWCHPYTRRPFLRGYPRPKRRGPRDGGAPIEATL